MIKIKKAEKYLRITGLEKKAEDAFVAAEMAMLASRFTDRTFGHEEREKTEDKVAGARCRLWEKIINKAAQSFTDKDLAALNAFYAGETFRREQEFRKEAEAMIKEALLGLEG